MSGKGGLIMRRTILLGAVLAGGLTVTPGAAAEAGGRQGHGFGQPWMFPHRQEFAQPSSLRLYPLWRPHVVHFAPRPQVRCFARGLRAAVHPPGARRALRGAAAGSAAEPAAGVPGPERSPDPAHRRHSGPAFRRPPGPSLRRPPGRPLPDLRPGGSGPGLSAPPEAGLSPRNEAFGIPHRSGGLTIIVRDPAGVPPWR